MHDNVNAFLTATFPDHIIKIKMAMDNTEAKQALIFGAIDNYLDSDINDIVNAVRSVARCQWQEEQTAASIRQASAFPTPRCMVSK